MLKKLGTEINNLNVNTKDYIITVLFSFVLSFLLVSPFIAIFVNLLIFVNFDKFLIFLIVFSAHFGVSLFLKFYLEGLSKGRIKNINSYVIYI
nr:hypothetical protein [Acholeplasmatales bacterium]